MRQAIHAVAGKTVLFGSVPETGRE